MTTSKIKSVSFSREWANPKGGTIYYHQIEFDNGDKGSCGAKDKLPSKLSVGTEHTYELLDGKIKMQQPQMNQFGGGKPKDNSGMAVGASINNAITLCAHGIIPKDAIKVTAKWILDLSIELKKEYEGRL
jgi:hypothetical protein